jgi:hypothetical protein
VSKTPVYSPLETAIHLALVEWCQLFRDGRQKVMHIPNEGKRTAAGHALQEALGRRKGAADLFIPCARGGWYGFWLELKRKGETLKEAQAAFAIDMQAEGYLAAYVDNLDDGMKIIADYMAGELKRPGFVYYYHPVNAGD